MLEDKLAVSKGREMVFATVQLPSLLSPSFPKWLSAVPASIRSNGHRQLRTWANRSRMHGIGYSEDGENVWSSKSNSADSSC